MSNRNLFLIRFILLFFISTLSLSAQNVTIIKFPDLETILNKKNDTLYVINFWATWCKPCVEEMPSFLKAEEQHKNEKVKFVFVSLNFKREYETKVIPFLKERNITSTILLLDEPDYNSWIDKVDGSWQGSMPATLLFNKSERKFFEKEFTFESLQEEIQSFNY